MNTDKDILLSKWLQGTISESELAVLSDQYELDLLSEILAKQDHFDLEIKDPAQLWDSLNTKISAQRKPDTSHSRRRLFLIGLLAILVGAIIYFFFSSKNVLQKVISPKSETVPHLFADQSEVILSPGSAISYDELDWDKERRITLVGQAFFKVKSGSPFIVDAGPGTVSVLGTEFEIWEKDGDMKVTCVEGRVKVENLSGDKQTISIGQSVSLNSAKMSDVMTHTLKNAEFLSGRYNFQKINIVSLTSEIERFYNVAVSLENIDHNINFSGVLLLDDIDKACSYIAETLDLKYERTLQSIKFSKN